MARGEEGEKILTISVKDRGIQLMFHSDKYEKLFSDSVTKSASERWVGRI